MSLNDIYSEMQELFNKTWDIKPGSPDLFRQGALYERPPEIPKPEELTRDPAKQEELKIRNIYFNLFMSMLSNLLLNKVSEASKITPSLIDHPEWIYPPYYAENIDAITPEKIKITPATTLSLIKIWVPKNSVVIIEGIGQALESSQAWDDVEWNIKVNNNPLPSPVIWKYSLYSDSVGSPTQKGELYKDFKAMLGEIYNPYHFKKAFILQEHNTFEITAKNDGSTDHYAMLRINGYAFKPKHTAIMGKGYVTG